MSLFLKPRRGGSSVAVAICDRCQMKKHYDDLKPDRENPGMRVCNACNDSPDPYKKPPRQPEVITLRYPRPEKDLE